jgi:hypothetical protein
MVEDEATDEAIHGAAHPGKHAPHAEHAPEGEAAR